MYFGVSACACRCFNACLCMPARTSFLQLCACVYVDICLSVSAYRVYVLESGYVRMCEYKQTMNQLYVGRWLLTAVAAVPTTIWLEALVVVMAVAVVVVVVVGGILAVVVVVLAVIGIVVGVIVRAMVVVLGGKGACSHKHPFPPSSGLIYSGCLLMIII